MNNKKFGLIYSALLLSWFTIANPVHAGLFKWIEREFIPTVTGKRPLKIDPNPYYQS